MKTRNKNKIKKSDVAFIIANLILSVFAFAAIVGLNTEFVSGEGELLCKTHNAFGGCTEYYPTDTPAADIPAEQPIGAQAAGGPPPAIATTPVSGINAIPSNEFFGKAARMGTGTEALKEAGITKSGEYFIKDGSYYVLRGDQAISVSNYKVPFLDKTFTGIPAHLAQGVTWALFVFAGIELAGNLFGADPETISAAQKAAMVGIIAWKGLDLIAEKGLTLGGHLAQVEGGSGIIGSELFGISSGIWAVGVAIVIFLIFNKKQDMKTVHFTCLPWQAPKGGANCEKCNNKDLPCSEYQCRSLGQACDIVNKGTSEEKCVWVNRQDVNPPTIEPLQEALQINYKYNPDNTISPPDRGVKIMNANSENGCIPAFTPLTFGVKMNEPAACKVDVLRKNNYTDMSNFMSSGLLRYNHTFALSLPGPEALAAENITIQNDGNYNLFVRCQDANGNSNVATFVFKYCVDKGPDTTPPLIVSTNLLNNMPISYNQTSIGIDVYTNEPASCKWSHNDRDYDSMEENMICSSSVFEYNAKLLYKCATNLTGLKSQTANDFYFRCRDKPTAQDSDRNTNAQSYKFTLIGTQPLVIDSVKPNGTIIKDSTGSVKATLFVNTSAGYDKGKAVCYYSNTGTETSYIKFFKTDSFQHSQDLFLTAGNYQYFVKCTDLGGNSDYERINFTIETDLTVPTVVRAFKEENNLKLITNENATCVYSTFGCNYEFSQGTNITTIDGTGHFTAWNLQNNFYVKCRDKYGNQPNPDRCSITVRPSKLL